MQRDEVVAALRAAGCVFAEDEADLLLAAPRDLASLVARRAAGEPLEHLLGWVEFAGRRVEVSAGTFVPRRRTELLVTLASRHLYDGAVVVELCCGVAAVATVLGSRRTLTLHASDLDPVATAVAARNIDGAGSVHTGDLYAPLPREAIGRVDVVVANAPYVPTDEIALMPSEARDHEPLMALDGGSDGLDLARRVFSQSLKWLSPTGRVMVETSERQATSLVAHCRAVGLRAVVERDEDLDATAVVGARPLAPQ